MLGQSLILYGLHPLLIFFFLQRSPPILPQCSSFLVLELSPPRIHAFFVRLEGPLLLHFRHPVFFGLCVPAFHMGALFLCHAIVASHALLDLFGLEGLILPVGLHPRHTFVVASTVKGFHFLDAIHGRILSLPIEFLVPFIELGVPLFAWLARSGCIHGLTLAIGQHIRLPRPVTFGMDSRFSVDAWHVGPAVVV